MSFFGFLGTTGAEYMQYLVADHVTLPRALRSFYSEKILSLPHSLLLNDHKQEAQRHAARVNEDESSVSRAKYGLSEDKFVYCCFTQLCKIDPDVFRVWMKILKRVPNAVLWLLRFPSAAETNLLREAKKQGVREDRLVFSDVVPREEHLQRCALADLALDTFVCGAHTSAGDLLWAGTPLLTLPGEKLANRVSASLLTAAGLGNELIVKNVEEYEEAAVQLAEDGERLYALRRHLETTRESSAAFDAPRWVRNFESGLSALWKRQEQNHGAEHIDVEDKDALFVVNDSLL